MVAEFNPQVITSCKTFSRLAGVFTFAVGCMVLLGWLLDIRLFKALIPAWVAVPSNSGLCFALSGLSLYLLNQRESFKWQGWFISCCAFFVTLLGILNLCELFFQWNLGIDQLLFKASPSVVGAPGRLPLIGAINFSLLGMSLLLALCHEVWVERIWQFACLIVFMFALVAFLDIILVPEISYTGVSLYSALTFGVFSLGLILLRPDKGIAATVTADTVGGKVARGLLPAALGIPVLVQWMVWTGSRVHLYDDWLAMALAVVTNVALLVILITGTARHLNTMDLERQKSEEALRESEETFSTAFRSVSLALVISTMQGKFVEVNQTFCDLVGFSREEIIGKTSLELGLMKEEDRNKILTALEGADDIRDIEIEIKARDNSLHNLLYSINVISLNGISYRLSSGLDITARRQAETMVLESEQFLQSTLDALTAHIAVLDESGIIVAINRAWREFADSNHGTPISCGVGANYLDACGSQDEMDGDEASQAAKGIRDVTEGRLKIFSMEYSCHSPNERRWFMVSITRFHSGGRVRVVVAHENITDRKLTEETLRESEERLRIVTENACVGLVMVDRERRYTFANAAYAEMLALSSSDIVGLRVADVLSEQYEDQIRPHLDRAFAGEQVAYELRRPMQEGVHWYAVRYESMKMRDEVVLVVVVITDVTEIKQAEENVRESESRMAGIINAAMDAIITIDESQCITVFNPAAAKMFGYLREDTMGQPIEMLIPQRFREAHAGHVRSFQDSGMTTRRMGSLGTLYGLHASGKEFPIEASISQIELAGHKYFTVILRDITERKRAEEDLRKAHDDLEIRIEKRTKEIQEINETLRTEVIERRMAMDALRETSDNLRDTHRMLRMVLNHIPQAIFWKNRNSVFLGCNNRLAADAGLASPEDVVGKDDFSMPWAQHADAYRADDSYVIDTGNPKLNIEECLTKSDGSQIWLLTNKVPLHDLDGEVAGVLASYEDITNQKESEAALKQAREEAENANRAKSEFLSRMSHELRTPLNAILGFGQILELDNELREDDRDAITHILKSGRHLLSLINEVLDIARIESGHLSLSPEPTEVARAVQDVINMVNPLAKARTITIENDVSDKEDIFVLADQQRFRQILLNLLSNAIKYNRDGGQVIISYNEDNGFLRINVADTGSGLSAQEISKLFVAFERLQAAKTNIEGTGIGLVLCKGLIEAMNGEIGIESTPGEGSTFWVKLPVAQNPIEQLDSNQSSMLLDVFSELAGDKIVKHTILYIEDNVSNLNVIQRILKNRSDIQLLSAMQGSLGVDLALQHIPDLILLDLHLPDIAGEEVLRRLQADTKTSSIPVIVLSADAMPGQISKMQAAGVRAYLTKPLNLREFLEVIDKCIRL